MNINDTQTAHAEPLYGVGVDIGGTKILIVIANEAGEVVFRKKVNTSCELDIVSEHIQESLREANVSPERVAAFGFGVPGIVNSEEGIVIEAATFKWSHEPFQERMQTYFDKPIFVENDVKCAAMGERWAGSAQQLNDFVVVAIGTGIGSAIIVNGSLVNGHQYMAGEIAYLVTEQDIANKHVNRFGEFGLFEQKVSGTALAQHGISPQELFERYGRGEEKCTAIIHAFVTQLSICIANMVSMLNPQKVILGGGVSQSLPAVIELIRTTVADLTPIAATIELATLGEEAGAIGAVALAFEKSGVVRQTSN